MDTEMHELKFPLYVRFLSAFQTLNDANLTRSEQAFMARRYRKTAGNKNSRKSASLEKYRTFLKWDHEYQKLTRWDDKMDFLIERMQEDTELYVEFMRWSVKTGKLL